MKWKMEAMDKLRKFDAMRMAARNIPDEIARLEIDAKSIRTAHMEPTVKKEIDPGDDAMLDNLMLRRELSWTLQQVELWLRTVNAALSALTPEEKLVLSRLYINPEKGGVDLLCQELQLEQSSIYRKRDKALYKFTTALYGCAES